jgi:hypothetical protein
VNHSQGDARFELFDALTRHADELAACEAACLGVAEHVVHLWRAWWQEDISKLQVDEKF